METLTLFVLMGEFGCNRIIDHFIEQDSKFEYIVSIGLESVKKALRKCQETNKRFL